MQQTLSEIFHSAPFRASKQSQHLLQYIVDQTLAGHGELLKERLIGVNVFGRRPDYDTNEDPIVRARVAEVRKRLAQFYLAEGNHTPVRIEISPGSYLASINEVHRAAEPETAAVAAVVEPASEAVTPIPAPAVAERVQEDRHAPERRMLRWIPVVGCLAVCLAIGAWFAFRTPAPIDIFWKPFVDASGPVLVYSGANAVYMLSNDFLNEYQATHRLDTLESQGREYVIPLSSQTKLKPQDLVALKNDFVTIGDLAANVRVASLLSTRRKSFDLRCGEDVAFGDLRESPTILIGAFNNSWTIELTGDLPYRFGRGLTIKEEGGGNQVWTPSYTTDQIVAIDYAVVTRIPHSKTGKPLIAIAGITQSGTRAAADFITDPDQVKKLVSMAPKDWAQKNLQIVLQTKVVNAIPTSPTIVAMKSW
ncbi:MAG: hypothetical protein ACLGXA_17895 [Acidobacteriota bacterium]